MSDETWWTGDEAVENGFCDELMFEEAQTVIENAGRIIVNSVPIDMGSALNVSQTVIAGSCIMKTPFLGILIVSPAIAIIVAGNGTKPGEPAEQQDDNGTKPGEPAEQKDGDGQQGEKPVRSDTE